MPRRICPFGTFPSTRAATDCTQLGVYTPWETLQPSEFRREWRRLMCVWASAHFPSKASFPRSSTTYPRQTARVDRVRAEPRLRSIDEKGEGKPRRIPRKEASERAPFQRATELAGGGFRNAMIKARREAYRTDIPKFNTLGCLGSSPGACHPLPPAHLLVMPNL